MSSNKYEYDVALSFAGEDRTYVDAVATALKPDVSVFYDSFEEAHLWGKDLYSYLHDVYQNKARFTVMFISEHYAKKLWTLHERKAAQVRAFREREEYISLAPNLFYGTTIAVTILVLAKNKRDTNIQFIDASGEEFFKKETNNNVMNDDHITKIMDMFDSKEHVPHVAESVQYEKIVANDYNLSVSSYVEAKDTREKTDIVKLNADIKITVEKINQLRADIDAIVAEIEA